MNDPSCCELFWKLTTAVQDPPTTTNSPNPHCTFPTNQTFILFLSATQLQTLSPTTTLCNCNPLDSSFFPCYSILILQQHCFSNLSSGAVQESINFKTWDLQRTLSGTHYNMYPGDLELFKDSYSCSGVGKYTFLTSTKLRILFVFTLKRYCSLQPAFKTSH